MIVHQNYISLVGALIDKAKDDYQHAPRDSTAYASARKLVEGEICEHVECDACQRECEFVYDPHGANDCPVCGHNLKLHVLAIYDWKEWREHLANVVGISGEELRRRIVS